MADKNIVEIDLSALEHNYKKIVEKTPNREIICIVKDDAYGHGAERCVRRLLQCGARFFAVSDIDEALQLRQQFGTEPKILILGYVSPESAPILCEHNITVTLYSYEYAKKISECIPPGKRLTVHIKIDSGMNRLGFFPNNVGFSEIDAVRRMGNFDYEGIFTHFCCSDETEKPITKEQYERFSYAMNTLRNMGITFRMHHCCNSAAIINYPEMQLDTVRCGIILYGLLPSPETENIGLLPVLTFKSFIAHIHKVKAGEAVSYGATYTAEHDMLCATLPLGYGIGFRRAYANNTELLVNGKKTHILGRVCMDMCMIDITDMNCSIGDEVTVFGKGNSLDEFAAAAGTIPYECVCLIRNYVPRIYID